MRILLDPEQVSSPSCQLQPNTMRMLKRWKVPMRIARAQGSINMMHLEQWIWDDGLVLICSMNASRNSAHHAFEGGMFSKFTEDVDSAKRMFEKLWETGLELPPEAYVDPPPKNRGFGGSNGTSQTAARGSHQGSNSPSPAPGRVQRCRQHNSAQSIGMSTEQCL